MSFSTFLVEAFVVGVTFALLVVLVSYIIPPSSMPNLILIGFLAGVLGHLLFEVLGLNKYYCSYKNNL